MDNNIAIKVEELTKTYPIYKNKNDRMKEAFSLTRRKYHEVFFALNNLNFTIQKGETIGIIGHNGSGKSTLLKILTGVLSPTSGTATIDGKVSALLELGAGFNFEMTGIENIYLNGTIMGYTKEEMDKRVPEIIEFADIGDFIKQPVKLYSSGMFIRLAFAVAINVDPDILIVDEALSVGDIKFQNKCLTKFREFIDQNKTIIIVSHSVSLIRSLCKRVIWLDQGSIYKIGEPKTMTQEYLDYMTHGVLKDRVSVREKKESIELNNTVWKWIKLDGFERSGNGDAKIIAVAFVDRDTNRNIAVVDENINNVSVKFYIEVYKDIAVPLLAFGIVNRLGETILHSNNEVNNIKIGNFKKNNEYIISYDFTMPRIQNGEYHLAISLDRGYIKYNHEILDRLNYVVDIKVLANDYLSKQYGYCLINNIELNVSNVNED